MTNHSNPSDTPQHAGCRAALVVGTPSSVRQLHVLLGQAQSPPAIVGCLTTTPAGDSDGPVPVLGVLEDLSSVIAKRSIELVLVSLPLALQGQIQEIQRQLNQIGIDWRFMPTLEDQLAGNLRPVRRHGDRINTCQLIDRQPRPLDVRSIRSTLGGRCVLITGAGGSIGSQLARLVGRFEPSKLVLVDRSENGLVEVDRQIARSFPDLNRVTLLHDVTDAAGTAGLVATHRPDTIFHAAAHKHVSIMEDHPAQAVENNFYGTRSIADAADRGSVNRFVMISTDKAVNPSSVMGATKRLAELYIQHLNGPSRCVYSMVRFGNVLESTGSVIPLWDQQLAQGGPITVTHRQMYRYFMTIPEAAGLVLQSAALSSGGEVFLLDMGQPVRILDLAFRFIRHRGLVPEVDIPIRVTGPRPGEKLFEELAYDSEDVIPTPHESVRIWRTEQPDPRRIERILTTFDRLRNKNGGRAWQHARPESIVAALHAAVPEMVTAAAAG